MFKAAALTVILFLACATPAQARDFIVEARSVSPASPSKTVTCTSQQKQCFLSLLFENGSEPIDIAISFHENEARFQFMQGRRYLPVKNDGQTLLVLPLKSGHAEAKTNVFDPESLEPDGAIRKLVVRTGRLAARLEITVRSENVLKD